MGQPLRRDRGVGSPIPSPGEWGAHSADRLRPVCGGDGFRLHRCGEHVWRESLESESGAARTVGAVSVGVGCLASVRSCGQAGYATCPIRLRLSVVTLRAVIPQGASRHFCLCRQSTRFALSPTVRLAARHRTIGRLGRLIHRYERQFPLVPDMPARACFRRAALFPPVDTGGKPTERKQDHGTERTRSIHWGFCRRLGQDDKARLGQHRQGN